MKSLQIYIILIFLASSNILLSQEICDNGIDDDGDGLTDLQDILDCNCGQILDVVSGDFEEMSCCPESNTAAAHDDDIACLADGWIIANEIMTGPDYFNMCGFLGAETTGLLVPLPIPSGDGAVGFGTAPTLSESIGYCMTNEFVVGQNYSISFFVGFNDGFLDATSTYLPSLLDFEFVLWGNNSCDNLPASGEDCLESSGDDWYIITTIPFNGVEDSTWLYVSSNFTATSPSTAIAIGGNCNLLSGSESTYHFLDNVQITGQFQTPPTQEITISGNCTNGVFVEVPNVGIGYQWYLEGVAISGATGNTYEVPSDQQGNYTVMIDYGGSCEIPIAVDVNFDLEVLDVSGEIEDISCYGENDGSISASVTPNLNMPIDYDWSNNENTSTIEQLGEGVYTVTVTDDNGCYGSTSFTVTEPPVMEVELNITQASGTSLATGEVTISGGTPEYDILWCNFTTSEETTLQPGPCWVIITDENGCEQTLNFEVYEPLEVLTNTDFGTCSDTCDSEIVMNIFGGQPPYSVLWSNSEIDTLLSNLCDDLYAFIVTDNNGTEFIGTVDLESDEASLTVSAVYDSLICIGSNLNTISISPSGGLAPYSYEWSTQDTTATIDSLSAGIYTVLITDSLGCSAVDTFILTHFEALTVTSTITSASCGGANGTITTSFPDTVALQSILWSNGDTTAAITGLTAGNYALSVVDSYGCMYEYAFQVDSDSDLEVVTNIDHEQCDQANDGSIELVMSGGTAPFTILWSDGTDDNPKENLGPGTYDVTVTDFNTCIWTESFTIETLSNLEITSVITNNSCANNADGSIDVTIAQGVAFAHEWDNGEITQDIDGLSAGFYSLTITDVYNCLYIYEFEVQTNPAFSIDATITNTRCEDVATGSINLALTPAADYDFIWSNGDTTQNSTNLFHGSYSVTVTDAMGCEQIMDYEIDIDAPYDVEATIENTACLDASTGNISLTLSPSDSYSFIWDNGDTTQNITNLESGTYTVSIKDTYGCEQLHSFEVFAPDELTLTAQLTHIGCDGGAHGAIDVEIEGGNSPYHLVWSTGDTITTLEDLDAGTYDLNVEDDNGCTLDTSFTIIAVEPLIVSESVQHVRCFGEDNGQIDLTIQSGNPPYDILWSEGETSTTIQNLEVGEYSVTITDEEGCTFIQSYMVNGPDLLIIQEEEIISPDAQGDNGSIDISVIGGNPGYTYEWDHGEMSPDLQDLTWGTYTLVVTDTQGCTTSQSWTFEPTDLEVTAQVQNNRCYGECEGGITLEITGGFVPYNVMWSDGQSGDANSWLCDGTYTATITDDSGQGIVLTDLIVSSPEQILLSGTVYPVSCLDSYDASISVATTGGTEPYTYQWDQSDTQQDSISSLSPGEYTVHVTDDNLCTESAIYTIEDINLIEIEIEQLPYDCEEGSREIVISGENTYDYPIYINGEESTLDAATLDALGQGTYHIAYAINEDCILPIAMLEIEETLPYELSLLPASLEVDQGSVVNLTLSESSGASLAGFILEWTTINDFSCADQDCLTISLTCSTEEILELKVTDQWGCEEFFSVPIRIFTRVEDITIGNIFSPNDDLINDELSLLPDVEGLSLLTFHIYDRWGNEVHRYLPGTEPVWNGMKGNQFLSTGVYVYSASYEYNGEIITKVGDITLIR